MKSDCAFSTCLVMIQHEGQRQGAVCVYVPIHAGGGRKRLKRSSVA